jgi:hypothetical protein
MMQTHDMTFPIRAFMIAALFHSSFLALSHNLNPICNDRYKQPRIGTKTAATSEYGFIACSHNGDVIAAAETAPPTFSLVEVKSEDSRASCGASGGIGMAFSRFIAR